MNCLSRHKCTLDPHELGLIPAIPCGPFSGHICVFKTLFICSSSVQLVLPTLSYSFVPFFRKSIQMFPTVLVKLAANYGRTTSCLFPLLSCGGSGCVISRVQDDTGFPDTPRKSFICHGLYGSLRSKKSIYTHIQTSTTFSFTYCN